MPRLVEQERQSRAIREVVLRRADVRNALCIELLEQLAETFNSLAAESGVRVVILRGDGPVFSAGLDLREAANDAIAEKSAAALKNVFRILSETPLATIAAVQGGAFAGGAGLMAACDLVVAADDVKIGFPEARRGLLPALISEILRPKVRDGDLRILFLVGEPISAQRAQQMGLIQRLVPAANLLDEARRLAKNIVAGGPDAIRHTKRLLKQLNAHGAADPAALAELHLAARHSPEAREGLAAFLEKREPNWVQEANEP